MRQGCQCFKTQILITNKEDTLSGEPPAPASFIQTSLEPNIADEQLPANVGIWGSAYMCN